MPFAVRSQAYGPFCAPPVGSCGFGTVLSSGPRTSAKVTELPWLPGESPKLQAAVKSHPFDSAQGRL
jgi:hypothetical protein